MSDNFTSPEGVEVRTNEDGTIDEIVTNKPVHTTFEYMDDDSIDLHIGDVQATVWTRMKAKIHTGASVEPDGFCLGTYAEDPEKYPIDSVHDTLDRLLDSKEAEADLGEIEHKGEKVTVKIKVVRGER